jgi:hypothetical protein
VPALNAGRLAHAGGTRQATTLHRTCAAGAAAEVDDRAQVALDHLPPSPATTIPTRQRVPVAHVPLRIVRRPLFDQIRREAHSAAPGDDPSESGRDMLGSCCSVRTRLDPERSGARNEEREWVRLGLQFRSEEDRHLPVPSEPEGLPWKDLAAKLDRERGEGARMRSARWKPRSANILRRLHAGRAPDESAPSARSFAAPGSRDSDDSHRRRRGEVGQSVRCRSECEAHRRCWP